MRKKKSGSKLYFILTFCVLGICIYACWYYMHLPVQLGDIMKNDVSSTSKKSSLSSSSPSISSSSIKSNSKNKKEQNQEKSLETQWVSACEKILDQEVLNAVVQEAPSMDLENPNDSNQINAIHNIPGVSEDAIIQIALDRLHFSPGCIDGSGGGQTRMAVEAWQISRGANGTGRLNLEERSMLLSIAHPIGTYVLQEDDFVLCQNVTKWSEKALEKELGYTTIKERLGEFFHCSQKFLDKLNPQVNWNQLRVGDSVVVPNSIEASITFPSFSRIEVNQTLQHVRLFNEQDRLVAHFPCSIAKMAEKRYVGQVSIANVAPNPNYTYNPAMFSDAESRQSTKKLIIPPGPNNPVGVAWIGLSLRGYGIHGTPVPEQIGRTQSHGCIRLANWNVWKLAQKTTVGMSVEMKK